ncbi:NfeD family protein [Saccharophagus sp. K07]|uniref:NfeD family protein n=1 Tax=Saccharophagus sp. K07 TaxID=2283636 RepID=UPI001651F544|nr:NfeD family protein [Saccharophagus sp. K07]MBC6907450.1 NfeD family protein [Saccharophagus sp. K07]
MFDTLNGWHWLALGIALLLLDVLGVGGILIGASGGAIALALLLAFVDLSWQLQLVVFGVFAMVGTFIFWKFFRVKPVENATSKLNNRRAQLIGMRASLMQPVQSGRGKVQIQDALWTVSCDEDLPQGTLVEVTGYDDQTLIVKKV